MSGGKSRRRAARAQAFQVLYGLSFARNLTEAGVRRAWWQAPGNAMPEDAPAQDAALPAGFAWELVLGVWQQTRLLDAIIGRHSHNWRVERMGRIELTLLRLGLFEMLFREDVPVRVAINEALELAGQFGGQGAGPFVNGILDAVAKAVDSGEDVLASVRCLLPDSTADQSANKGENR